jgi:uncharacterized protein (DUF58 family)
MPRLTPTGWLFLLLALAFYGAAQTSQSGLLLLLVGVAVGCLILNFFAARRAVKSVEVHAPRGELIGEGDHPSQPWQVVNKTKKTVGLLQAETASGPLFRVGSVPPNGTVHITPGQLFLRRGVFPLAEFRLTSIQPFGLFRSVRSIHLPGEVVVAPTVYPVLPPRAAGHDTLLGGKFKGRHSASSGACFAGVRPFQQGDPLKQIHWKSSAKGLGLMVKTFDEELSGRTALILDNGGGATAETLDDAVRAAGALVFAALDEGNHIEVADLDRGTPLAVPPFADGHEVLDWLARLPRREGQAAETRDFDAVVNTVSRHAAVAFILTRFGPAAADTIQSLLSRRRPVDVYLPLGANRPEGCGGARFFAYSRKEITALP